MTQQTNPFDDLDDPIITQEEVEKPHEEIVQLDTDFDSIKSDDVRKKRTTKAPKAKPKNSTGTGKELPDVNEDPTQGLPAGTNTTSQTEVDSLVAGAAGSTPVNTTGNKPMSVDDLTRMEEISNEMVKTEGRFIDGVDNARAGTTIDGRDIAKQGNTHSPNMDLYMSEEEMHGLGKMRADGVILDDNGVLDTGLGAQAPVPEDQLETELEAQHDPTSSLFLTCVNKSCAYRAGCMRYRKSADKTLPQFVFFPDSCRTEGIYIDIQDHPNIGLAPMEVVEPAAAPGSL